MVSSAECEKKLGRCAFHLRTLYSSSDRSTRHTVDRDGVEWWQFKQPRHDHGTFQDDDLDFPPELLHFGGWSTFTKLFAPGDLWKWCSSNPKPSHWSHVGANNSGPRTSIVTCLFGPIAVHDGAKARGSVLETSIEDAIGGKPFAWPSTTLCGVSGISLHRVVKRATGHALCTQTLFNVYLMLMFFCLLRFVYWVQLDNCVWAGATKAEV